MLQILHVLPHFATLFLMGDKLRPHLLCVKYGTTISCGRLTKQHNMLGKYSRLQYFNRAHRIWAKSVFSAALPPNFRQFSTAFPQRFAQRQEPNFSSFRLLLHRI
jgi:hypothetical protein